MSSRLLVVDLCGTIVRVNTTHGFLCQAPLSLPRRMAIRFLLSRIVDFLASRCGAVVSVRKKALVATIFGINRETLSAMADAYARQVLASRARREVVEHVEFTKREGRRVVLASASLDFIVAAFGGLLGVETAVCTRLRYRTDGSCCGLIQTDATGSKLALLSEYLGQSSFDFDVITDNAEDTDLMQAASNTWNIKNAD